MHASKNFTISELCHSDTARQKNINNYPIEEQYILNLTAIATAILQPLRDHIGQPIRISSGYRCEKLNRIVGGAPKSKHLTGQAVDIDINGDMKLGRKMFDYIRQNLPFDQLICEHNIAGVYWIHVSYVMDGNRRQTIDDLLKR